MGSRFNPEPSASARARVQLWEKVGDLQLPSAQGETLNQQLTQQLYSHQPEPCLAEPVVTNRSQRALFDHLAALLQQRPEQDLTPFALGPINNLPPNCRQLLLLTGRLGGNQPGWLAAGVVSLPDGKLTQMLVSRWPPTPQVTPETVSNLADQLISSLTGRTP